MKDPAKTCPGSAVSKSWFVGLVKSQTVSAPEVQPYDPDPEFHRNLSYQLPMIAGADVKRLQERLAIEADGIFGPKTRAAVMNWQKAHPGPYGVTGGVTKACWDALFPKPMYRVTVDGVTKLDTAYEDKIVALVAESLKSKAKSIHIDQR